MQVTSDIEQFLKEEQIFHISSLPYNESFTEAMVNGQTIIEYHDGEISDILTNSWEKIKSTLIEDCISQV